MQLGWVSQSDVEALRLHRIVWENINEQLEIKELRDIEVQ